METAIDFIKEFRLSNYGWGLMDVLVVTGVILAGYIVANGLISFLPTATAGRSRKILRVVVSSMAYSIIIFFMLNALLIKDYPKLAAIILSSTLLYIRQGFRLLYEKYDNLIEKMARLIDKIARGNREEN